MFNLDPGKLLVIAVVAIILLGPDRLPQLARQLGGAWKAFNEFRHKMEAEVRTTMPDLPPTSEIARLARSPSALLDHLSSMAPVEEGETTVNGSEPADGEPTPTSSFDAAGTNGSTPTTHDAAPIDRGDPVVRPAPAPAPAPDAGSGLPQHGAVTSGDPSLN